MTSTKRRPICAYMYIHWSGKVVRVTTLIFTGDDEGMQASTSPVKATAVTLTTCPLLCTYFAGTFFTDGFWATIRNIYNMSSFCMQYYEPIRLRFWSCQGSGDEPNSNTKKNRTTTSKLQYLTLELKIRTLNCWYWNRSIRGKSNQYHCCWCHDY